MHLELALNELCHFLIFQTTMNRHIKVILHVLLRSDSFVPIYVRPPLSKSSAAASRELRSLGWTPPHKLTHAHRGAHTQTHMQKQTLTHLLSPRVDSAAVPVGSLRDLDRYDQNKVYTTVGKKVAARKMSEKTNASYLTFFSPKHWNILVYLYLFTDVFGKYLMSYPVKCF